LSPSGNLDYIAAMTITVDLPPEIQEWLDDKLKGGEFASPAEFVQSRLHQEWLEEKMDEAEREPAVPLTGEDWAQARQRLEDAIAKTP
jgi:Arc/MetJ-type ribon-helix-helix transcriptional regulator